MDKIGWGYSIRSKTLPTMSALYEVIKLSSKIIKTGGLDYRKRLIVTHKLNVYQQGGGVPTQRA